MTYTYGLFKEKMSTTISSYIHLSDEEDISSGLPTNK